MTGNKSFHPLNSGKNNSTGPLLHLKTDDLILFLDKVHKNKCIVFSNLDLASENDFLSQFFENYSHGCAQELKIPML